MTDITETEKIFNSHFSGAPLIVFSPACITLLGEMTDDLGGYFLGFPIEEGLFIAASPRGDNKFMFKGNITDSSFGFDTCDAAPDGKPLQTVAKAVINALLKSGFSVNGVNVYIHKTEFAEVAGIYTCWAAGLAFLLNELCELNIDKKKLFNIVTEACKEIPLYIPASEIYASLFAEKGTILLADTSLPAGKAFPYLYDHINIALFGTNEDNANYVSMRRQLYNNCAEGVQIIRAVNSSIKSLRDANTGILQKYQSELQEQIFDQCLYVIKEIERVGQACEALEVHNLKKFGGLMYLENSDIKKYMRLPDSKAGFIVETAKKNPEIIGSKILYGGSGSVCLIENEDLEPSLKILESVYTENFGIAPPVKITHISGGTHVIKNGPMA